MCAIHRNFSFVTPGFNPLVYAHIFVPLNVVHQLRADHAKVDSNSLARLREAACATAKAKGDTRSAKREHANTFITSKPRALP